MQLPSLCDASPADWSEPDARGLSTAAQLPWPGGEEEGPACWAALTPGLTARACAFRTGTGWWRPGSPSRAVVPLGAVNGAASRIPLPELRPRPPPRARRGSSLTRPRDCHGSGRSRSHPSPVTCEWVTAKQGPGAPCSHHDSMSLSSHLARCRLLASFGVLLDPAGSLIGLLRHASLGRARPPIDIRT